MIRAADIDGDYRYHLSRIWDRGVDRVLFVMLNPSTADAETDDPTIRKCVGFAKMWGYGGIDVVNLFALRATDKRELWKVYDPVGPRNDETIRRYVEQQGDCRIVAAWGSLDKPLTVLRGAVVENMLGADAQALRLTKNGDPWHPLYVPYAVALVPLAGADKPAKGASKP